MRAILLLLPLLLIGCAEAGGLTYQGRPLSLGGLGDAAYSAGARTGERLGTAAPAETPAAGVWKPR